MGSGAYGGTLAAPIWQDYMLAAQGTDCPDFPAPENPVEFSTWSGSHTVSAPSATPSRGGAAQPVKPTRSGNGTGSGNGKYPSDLYAPGAGQPPAPNPPQGGGGPPNGSGGGGGTGGEGAP